MCKQSFEWQDKMVKWLMDLSCQRRRHSLNDSSTCFHQDPEGISGLQWLYIMLLLLITLRIWLQNGLIIAVFIRSQQRQTATHFYICQLAATDFSVGLTLVYQVAIFFKRPIINNHYACALRYLGASMFMGASMVALLVMTYDRFFAIKTPLTYHSSLSLQRQLASTVISWTTPVVICFIVHRTSDLATTVQANAFI